ncbi:MAG: HAMP domain-containing protein [Chloroflexi bacterium]|nr:MAG: HAMP domain-containing protein [Chloroflexota bacterium]MBL1195144.1 HAMP domain-containing protein [Chloroflexota bacterium]NOH12429.1 GAF domain-containing protein [Chloroflexota bacterium]
MTEYIRRPRSIQGWLGLLFLAFVLLVTLSVGVTFWGIEAQKQDAVIINLAGRQRMLVQQMTRLAGDLQTDNADQTSIELQGAVHTFEDTLVAFEQGGQAPYSPGETIDVSASSSTAIQTQLVSVRDTWEDYLAALDLVTSKEQNTIDYATALQQVETIATQLITETDSAVRLFENAATQKVNRLRSVQIGFFISALILLAFGAWLTRRAMLDPLQTLQQAAERIRTGDIETPIHIEGLQETEVLSQTLESMRDQLRVSQERSKAWTKTLEDRVTQRTRELEALYEVSRDISSRLDVQEVLGSVTEKAQELLEAESATLCMLDGSAGFLSVGAHSGPSDAVIEHQMKSNSPLALQVLSGDSATACEHGECGGFCQVLAPSFRNSQLAAPLRVGNRVIGALCVGSSETDAFSEEARLLLTKLANSAAIALENARLYAQAERVAALEERHRIAADMHDGLGQTLSYLGLSVDKISDSVENDQDLDAISRLEKTRQIIDQATEDVRNAITTLIEEPPSPRSLQKRLDALANDFTQRNGSKFQYSSEIEQPLRLEIDTTEQILRVVGEAMLNAHQHSNGSSIDICLAEHNGDYVVTVEDNGNGFDPTITPDDGRQHFGLQIMQARAKRLGGELNVHSTPGEGTQVVLKWASDAPLKIVNA